MRMPMIAVAAGLWASTASASDLTISLSDAPAVLREMLQYQCGPGALELGLPDTPFPVLYLNAGANHLAVIEIRGERRIFANVYAGSGARYASGPYIWWDAAGRGASLSAEIPAKRAVQCRRLGSR